MVIVSLSFIFFVSSENSLRRSTSSFAFYHKSPLFGPRPPKGLRINLSFAINYFEYYFLFPELFKGTNESSNGTKFAGFYFG